VKNSTTQYLKQVISHNKKSNYQKYGFVADPKFTTRANSVNTLAKMPTKIYFNKPTNLSFHNLCTTKQPPKGLNSLLGLGHKFVLQKKMPPNQINHTLKEFCRDIRMKYFFADMKLPNDVIEDYNPRLYIKSKWEPPEADENVESRLAEFRKLLLQNIKNKVPKPANNLSRVQYKALKWLKNNNEFIIIQADKNLGPVILERSIYIERMKKDHLEDKEIYHRMSEQEVKTYFKDIRCQVYKLFLGEDAHNITATEKTFFKRLLETPNLRKPTIYLTAKIHKDPWSTRQVVSCVGSLLASVSTWIDIHLQKIKYLLPAYLKDSESLIKTLQNLNDLPDTAVIITCDAVSMYTNIDLDHCMQVMKDWFRIYKSELPTDLPTDEIIVALELVMKQNVFHFGYTWWKQLVGTAMGTPCACVIASFYYALHEKMTLLPKYKDNIIYYTRFIDDGFLIWNTKNKEGKSTVTNLEEFKKDLNDFGRLR